MKSELSEWKSSISIDIDIVTLHKNKNKAWIAKYLANEQITN